MFGRAGCCPACAEASAFAAASADKTAGTLPGATTTKTAATMKVAAARRCWRIDPGLLLLRRGRRRQRLATLFDGGAVVGVVHVGHVDPGVRHLVDGAVAVADPHVRIGVGLLGRGVVVPRGDLD